MNFNCSLIFILGLVRLGKGNIWRTEQCGQLDLQDYDAHSVPSSMSEMSGHAYRRPLQGQWCVMFNSWVTNIEWVPNVVPAHMIHPAHSSITIYNTQTHDCIKILYLPNIYFHVIHVFFSFFILEILFFNPI